MTHLLQICVAQPLFADVYSICEADMSKTLLGLSLNAAAAGRSCAGVRPLPGRAARLYRVIQHWGEAGLWRQTQGHHVQVGWAGTVA